MVYSRLFVNSTTEACTRHPDQGPPAVVVDDERPSTVPQAGVHLASLVAGTEHLLVQLQHHLSLTTPAPAQTLPGLEYFCLRATECSPRF